MTFFEDSYSMYTWKEKTMTLMLLVGELLILV